MKIKDETRNATISEFLKTKEGVESLLANDERCRNDDLWLILRYWESMQHITLQIPFDQLSAMTSAETITRVRREIQNKENKYLPTKADVLIKRRIRQETIHDYYSGQNPKLVEDVIRMRFAIK